MGGWPDAGKFWGAYLDSEDEERVAVLVPAVLLERAVVNMRESRCYKGLVP